MLLAPCTAPVVTARHAVACTGGGSARSRSGSVLALRFGDGARSRSDAGLRARVASAGFRNGCTGRTGRSTLRRCCGAFVASSGVPAAPEPAERKAAPLLLPPPSSPLAITAARLAAAYNLTALSLGATACVLVLAPGLALQEVGLGASRTLALQHMARVWGAAFLPAAVAAHSLSEAATHARLGSDTYKRLNLGISASALGTLALLAPPLLHGGLASAPLGGALALPLACVLSLVVSAAGYLPAATELKHGLLSLPAALATGTASLCTALAAPPNAVAGRYGALVAALALAAAALTAAPGAALSIAALPADAPAALVARATGIAAAPAFAGAVALADAAARGRLGASTFRALNAALGIAATLVLLIHAHTALVARVPVASAFAAAPAAAAAAAAFCLFQFATAPRKK